MLRNRSKDGDALKESMGITSGGYLMSGYYADKFYRAIEENYKLR